MAELGLRGLESEGFQALMDEAVATVARTLGVEYTKTVELLTGGQELLLRAGVGWEEELVGRARESAGLGSEAGYTLLSDEPVIMEDISTETRFRSSAMVRESGIVSGITAVIHGEEGPYGVLCAHSRSHRAFTEDDISFMQAVANVLGGAIERNEAQERLEEVREAERSRIARDLHDEALQDLSGAMAEAQLARRVTPQEPELSERLERLSGALGRAERQVRGGVYDLSLEVERERPFSELLEALVELHCSMAPEQDISLEVGDGDCFRDLSGTLAGSFFV